MSDSDNTDDLLTIPPDIYVIHTPTCSPLKMNNTCNNSQRETFEKTIENFTDNVESENTNVVSQTMDTIIQNGIENSTPFQNKNKYRNFLSNGNTDFSPITTIENGKSISQGVSSQVLSRKNLIAPTLDRLSEKSEPSSTITEFEEKLSKNSISSVTYNVNNKLNSPTRCNLAQVNKLLCEIEKTREDIKNKLQTNTAKIHEMRRENATSDPFEKRNENDVKKLKNIQQCNHDNNSVRCIKNSNTFVLPQPREPKPGNMLKLSKILSANNDYETLNQKLEAEVLKRKHCEEIIFELQAQTLQLQENLNVALKVDTQKDDVIEQLRLSWSQLVDHWKELEAQRQDLASLLEEEKSNSANNKIKFQKKQTELENRLHDAIGLADNYQLKTEQLTKSLEEFQRMTNNERQEYQNELSKIEKYLKLLEMEKNEKNHKIDNLSIELSQEKEKRLEAESKLSDQKLKFMEIQREKSELTKKYEHETENVQKLKLELVATKKNLDEVTNAETEAVNEMNYLKQEVPKMKNSLKEFYQKQLDTSLKDKVDEFQMEINKMRALTNAETTKQNRLLEEKLQQEINKLKHSHKVELSDERRLNQKHVNILKNELRDNRKKIFELEECLRTNSKVQKFTPNDYINNSVSDAESIYRNILLNTHEDEMNISRLRTDDDNNSVINSSQAAINNAELKQYIEKLLSPDSFDVSNNQLKSSLNMKHLDNFKRKPPWK